MTKKLPGPAVHRRAVVLFTAALLLGLGLPRASAESRQDEPTSLITSPGYTRTSASPAPGLTLFTYQNPDDDRVVHVLRADPDAAPLTVESTAGTSGARAEKTTDMLKSTTGYAPRWPHAGLNGGFWYRQGDTLAFMGISVQGGVVQSASCSAAGRGEAALIQHGRPYIGDFTTHLAVTAPGAAPMPLDGVNRHPGWMTGCAQGSGATADRSIGGGVFADASEIIAFTSRFKAPTPVPDADARFTEDDDPGAEAVVAADGTVLSLNPNGRGGVTVPTGGRVLQGTGTGADWLRAHATPGTDLAFEERLHDERFGDDIPLDSSVDVVNGHYPLVHNAQYAYTGQNTAVDPRSAIAVDGPGRTLFVTATGKSGRNGVTLDEFARILLDLGAVDGLNMDGGGSTTLVVEQAVVNRPSDSTGERPVADSLYIGHGGYGHYAD
ncbi:phosphodiester glycosidase family protein [Streptomyces anthocyanicus]|uniref:phosphodiester glycosidase family protein n=1 Tax=Streptomyces anthocyanicus TaxID=68174 RepID=UPI0036E87E1A